MFLTLSQHQRHNLRGIFYRRRIAMGSCGRLLVIVFVTATATIASTRAGADETSLDLTGSSMIEYAPEDGRDPRPGRENLPVLYLEASALKDAILNLVTVQPEATLQQVAAFANAGIARFGLTYQFVLSVPETTVPGSIWLDGESATYALRLRDDPITEPAGPCGEVWAPLPVTEVRADSLVVVHWRGAERVARPEQLWLDEMKIWSADLTTLLATVEVPWQTIPFGVTPDGRGILVYQPLYEEASDWWRRIKATHPDIPGDTPFLLLAVSEDGFRYVDDSALYVLPRSKRRTDLPGDPHNAYLGYEEFLDPHVVVEYSAPCT
jgi:hypothetical protein